MSEQHRVMQIRRGTAGDRDEVVKMNKMMAKETEDLDLRDEVLQPGCQTFLTDENKGLGFLCEVNGKIAGQIFITFEWSDWRNSNMWWIQSVYVKPDYRRLGIFKKLFQHVREEAKKAGAGGIRLYVDNDNAQAQATYLAMGMVSHYKVYEEEFGKL